MLKQKIIKAIGDLTPQELRTLLKLSGKSLQEQLGLSDDEIEAARAELRPEVREKLEGMCTHYLKTER